MKEHEWTARNTYHINQNHRTPRGAQRTNKEIQENHRRQIRHKDTTQRNTKEHERTYETAAIDQTHERQIKELVKQMNKIERA